MKTCITSSFLMAILISSGCRAENRLAPDECKAALAPYLAKARDANSADAVLVVLKGMSEKCGGSGYLEYLEAQALLTKGDLGKAEESIRRLDEIATIELFAKNELHLDLAVRRDDLSSVEARANSQVANPTSRGAGYALLGAIAAVRQDVDGQIRYFELAKEFGGRYSSNFGLISAYYVKKDYAKAAEAFDLAAEQTESIYLHQREATIAAFSNYLTGRYERSNEVIQKHLAINPTAANDEQVAILLKLLKKKLLR